MMMNSREARHHGVADLETALALTGFGKFHILLLLLGGFCFLSVGVEFSLDAYVVPAAQCDLDMTSSDMGVLHAVFLGGGILSSFLWGIMADMVGRKTTLITTMTVDGIVTIIASFSPSFSVFAFLRFISGFICGGPGSLINQFCAEFCSDKYRSKAIIALGFFWNIAWMLSPALAWGLIPLPWSVDLSFIRYTTWRLFTALSALPILIGALVVHLWVPETPKFLFTNGREEEAIEALQRMFRINTGRPKLEYHVRQLVLTRNDLHQVQTQQPEEEYNSFRQLCWKQAELMKELYAPHQLHRTLLCASAYFCNFFGYYGFNLWLPELFHRFEQYYDKHPNSSVTVCELSFHNLEDKRNLTVHESCQMTTVHEVVFTNTLIIGAVCCVGNVLAIAVSSKISGRLIAAGTMTLAGIFGSLIYFLSHPIHILMNAAILDMLMVVGLMVLNFAVVNAFPTRIRGVGVSLCFFVARIGAALSVLTVGWLIDNYCDVPIVVLAGSSFLCGGLSLLLPKDSEKAVE